jgi:hypothetical protein
LADVPADARQRLAELAKIVSVPSGNELTTFVLALLVDGEASLCATIVDESAARLDRRSLIPARGTFCAAVALRIVAGPAGARVAVWDQAAIDETVRSCSWVIEELAGTADRLQALAGATMGVLGETDEARRSGVLEKLSVLVAHPGDAIEAVSSPAAVVCVGAVEITQDGKTVQVGGGDILFPRASVDRGTAGPSGAILLVGDAQFLDEIAAAPPSLASIFSAPKPQG